VKITKRSLFNPFSDIKSAEIYARDIDDDMQRVMTAFAGRIRFGNGTTSGDRGENISGNFFTFTTDATPGTTNTVTHDFTETSKGAIVLEQDIAGHLITDSKTTTTTLFKSDVASVTFRIFLLK